MDKEEALLEKVENSFGDEEALARLAALGPVLLPVLRLAYRRLDEHEFISAQWYNRLLAVVAPDPVGEALALLGKVRSRNGTELAWVLRRFVRPEDRPRLLRPLRSLLARGERDLEKAGFDFPRLAVLCEAVGSVGASGDVETLIQALKAAWNEYSHCREKQSLRLFAPEIAPAAAAAAAGLLAVAERGGPSAEGDRTAWRDTCLEAALAQGCQSSYLIAGAQTPPMPFLFTRAPETASGLLTELARRGLEAEGLAHTLRYWLLVAREQGVNPALDPDSLSRADWLDDLVEQLLPDSPADRSALDVRSLVQPSGAVAEALRKLEKRPLDLESLSHAVEVLRKARGFSAAAPVAVEVRFLRAGNHKDGLEGLPEVGESLGAGLVRAGLPRPEGWRWEPPPLPAEGPAALDTLNAALVAPVQVCVSALAARSREEAKGILAALEVSPDHPLARHAVWRNLLAALPRSGRFRELFLEALEDLRGETEPALARSAAEIANDAAGSSIGPIFLCLLESPAAGERPELAERLIRGLSVSRPPGAGERILDFSLRNGWGEQKACHGMYLAVVVALGRLGVRAAVPHLVRLIGRSGLGSEIEAALLRIAAADPAAVDDATFGRAFEELTSDEYSEIDPSLMGPQARSAILRTLGSRSPASEHVGRVCRFLRNASKKGAAPPEALPLLLQRLPTIVAEAVAHPGETWEDRNWGGYSASKEEECAEAAGEAVFALASCPYPRESWSVLLRGLLTLDDLDLRRVRVPESGSSGPHYVHCNLWKALSASLRALEDPAVDRAVCGASSPAEALRSTLAVLEGNSS